MEDGDIQQCFQLLKKKTILNFYSNYLECFRCQPAVLTILAGPGDRRPEESLPAFVARQLAAKRSQAARLEETIRRYFTVFPPSRGYRQIRYLGERCLSLAIARDLQRAFLREARELVDETSRRTSRRRSDEETIPRGFASPRGPVRTISQSASPAVPSVVLSPYGNSLLPMMNGVYSYPMVGSFLESSKPPVCELPPSFHSLPLLVDNPQVNAMFGKMEASADAAKLNFFFPYSVLWLAASPAVRRLACEGRFRRSLRSEGETHRPVASLSPSIQPLYAVFPCAQGEDRDEIEVLAELSRPVQEMVETGVFGYASKLYLDIAEQLMSSGLLNKYQQFGISLMGW